MKRILTTITFIFLSLTIFSQDTIGDLFRASYRVFELQRNSIGIYRDSKLFSGTDFHPSSVANVGVGLMALCVADSMGWISDAEVLAEQTLKSMSGNQAGFNPDRNASGFYRHFINMNTGAQEWGSEYSTIDSGIFLCGALFAKKYFKNNTTIADYVQEIYNAMDWSKVIADVNNGRVYTIMLPNGNGQNGATLPPFSEYMIVSWLAMKAEENNPGPATQLWNLHYAHPDSLMKRDYQGISVLTDHPSSYIPSFTLQFPYYMCHDFTTSPDYLNYLKNARQADSLWFATNTNYQNYEWGLGAGSYNNGSGYHADEINENSSEMVSPHIIAGFIPVFPEAEQHLKDMYAANKGIFTLPTGATPNKILWRYSNTISGWSAPEVQGIDYSTMLFGLASLPQHLGSNFFAYYNDYDFPVNTSPVNTISKGNQLKIFPNPVMDILNISIENEARGSMQLMILDTTGRLIQTSYFTKNDKKSNYQLPVNALSSGIYFIELIGENGKIETQKFVKE